MNYRHCEAARNEADEAIRQNQYYGLLRFARNDEKQIHKIKENGNRYN